MMTEPQHDTIELYTSAIIAFDLVTTVGKYLPIWADCENLCSNAH